ncbi:MAG: hypothetical protein KKB70_12280 [Proteobacteria bacterium]|nr:hypothetical protein [Pseudomonadota bacterium]
MGKDPLAFLYEGESELAQALGELYTHPERFPYGEDVLIASLKDDGAYPLQVVDIYETRIPAVFYTIKVQDAVEEDGTVRKGFALLTGTGQASLALNVAQAIHEGMLGLVDTIQ